MKNPIQTSHVQSTCIKVVASRDTGIYTVDYLRDELYHAKRAQGAEGGL